MNAKSIMTALTACALSSAFAATVLTEDTTVTSLDSAGYTADSAVTLTVDLAADASYSGVISGPIAVVKKGAGRLTLSSQWTHTGGTTVAAGALVVPSEAYLCGSAATVTLDGGEIALTTGTGWSTRKLVVQRLSSGSIAIASGMSVTMNFKNCLTIRRARLRLTGAGRLYGTATPELGSVKDGVIAVENGNFRCGDQLLGLGYRVPLDMTLEIDEGGTVDVEGARFLTLPRYTVMRGGTISAQNAVVNYTNVLSRSARTFESITFGGTVTVEPSATPSKITNCGAALAPSGCHTIFDVKDGATLQIDSRISPGASSASAATRRENEGFTKIGAGTLKLTAPIDAAGTVYVGAGTLVLSQDAYLSNRAKLKCGPGAAVRLDDGTLLSSPVVDGVNPDPLISTAEVWMDASVLPYEDGQTVAAVPNFGTCGGSFANYGLMGTNEAPYAPTFYTAGINGTPALAFNGTQSLVLRSYTNHNEDVELFIVYQITNTGHYATTMFSMCCCNGACGNPDDYGIPTIQSGHICYSSNSDWLSLRAEHGAKRFDLILTGVSGVSGTDPFILTHRRCQSNNGQVSGKLFYGPSASDVKFTGQNGLTAKPDIEQIGLGGRLKTDGSWYGDARGIYGRIGEFICFSRYLTNEERAYVEAYLRRKWLGSTETLPALSGYGTSVITNLAVEVASGSATLASSPSGAATAEGEIVKTGAGELVYAAEAPDAAATRMADGSVRFANGNAGSAAAIWIDAADSASITLKEDGEGVGRVASIVNKGSAGGAFTPNPNAYNGYLVPGPEYKTGSDGINGLGVLSFDFFSALSTAAYTNSNFDTCRLCVYGVFERTAWSNLTGYGNASGPFSMVNAADTAWDVSSASGIHEQEQSEFGKRFYWQENGKTYTYFSSGLAGTGTPYLMSRQYGDMYRLYAEGCLVNGAMNYANKGEFELTTKNPPFNINFVQLGGRIAGSAQPACPADKGRGLNRMWSGKVGEFLVFSRRLPETEEAQLVAYLEKKWFGVGSGSATPPAFLTGNASAPSFRSGSELSLAAGSEVAFDATNAVAVGTLKSEGAVAVRARRPVGTVWRPLVSYDSFVGTFSSWTLLDARSTLEMRDDAIGLSAHGAFILIR